MLVNEDIAQKPKKNTLKKGKSQNIQLMVVIWLATLVTNQNIYPQIALSK
jgi:hypothetical protein